MKRTPCQVCGRPVGEALLTGRLARHLFTGEAPSLWLRAGERCPGSLVDADDFPHPDQGFADSPYGDGMTEETWAAMYFGRTEWDPHPRNRYPRYLEERYNTAKGQAFQLATHFQPRDPSGRFTTTATP